ncbi:hypothetical protein BGX29_004911 [Mortierella sp. GBA35]|nr:hypothetical protein BGX29_004911 [Mortierella sp. GBA35]
MAVQSKSLLLFLFTILFSLLAVSDAKPQPKKANIVLVHGAIADGSSWSKVIPRLQDAGHYVTAVQQPLSSIDDDVAKTKSVLAGLSGPIVLVGHSFGGVVITQAAHGNTNISALVYVAAFAPDEGETVDELGKNYPVLPSNQAFVHDSQGRLSLPQDLFLKYFAPDINKKDARIMASVQGPYDAARFGYVSGPAAWKEHPSYYVVAEKDQIIQPKLLAWFAKRIQAKKTINLPASHSVMLTHPKQVADLILEAANAAK